MKGFRFRVFVSGFLCKGIRVARIADGEENQLDGGLDSEGKGADERSWVQVVQGPSQAPVWSSHKLSEDEIEHLQQCFSKVLVMPGSLLDVSRQKWEGVAVIFRSLSHRVPAVWVLKEVRVRLKLAYDPKVFPVGEDHIVLRVNS